MLQHADSPAEGKKSDKSFIADTFVKQLKVLVEESDVGRICSVIPAP